MTGRKTVFISDQDPRSVQETTRLLTARGFEARGFASGEEAIAAAHAAPPDLFITSMGLKGEMDGLKFVRALKADEALTAVPIVLLTGARRVMNLPFAFSPDPEWFPVADVIEKPARPSYLYEVLDRILGAPGVSGGR